MNRTWNASSGERRLAPNGVIVARLELPAGMYIVHAKVRVKNTSATTANSAACFFAPNQGVLVHDGDNVNAVPPLAQEGLALLGSSNNGGTVRVECYGPADVAAVNPVLVALRVGTMVEVNAPWGD